MPKSYFNTPEKKADLAAAIKGVGVTANKKRRKLLRLSYRDGKCCHWCKEEVRWAWEPGMNQNKDNVGTFDHKKLAKNGGKWHLNNGVLACKLCNNIRGDKLYENFKKLVATEGIPALTAKYRKKPKEVVDALVFMGPSRELFRKEQNRLKNKARRQRKWAKTKAFERSAKRWAIPNNIIQELCEWGQVLNQLAVVF